MKKRYFFNETAFWCSKGVPRDNHAETRVFTKRSCGPKLLIGGCRACFGGLETILEIIKNPSLWSEIVDLRLFFS